MDLASECPSLPHTEPDGGLRCVALSALLHAAAFGIFFLAPPGTTAFSLDDTFAPMPRGIVIFHAAEPMRQVAPPAPEVATGAAAGPITTTPTAHSAAHRDSTHSLVSADPLATLAALAGMLRASATGPTFVAADALAALGNVSAASSDGPTLDMIGTGRGTGGTGDTIGAPQPVLSGGGVGIGSTCSEEEFTTRASVMGRIAAVASCNGLGPMGMIGIGARGSRGAAIHAADSLEGGPDHGRMHCGCGWPYSSGALSREVVRRVVARHRNEIRACYERALTTRPDLEGRVTAEWVIAPDGRVQSTSLDAERSDVRSQQVESCVTQAISRWTFPDAVGSTIVSYPFVLGTDA